MRKLALFWCQAMKISQITDKEICRQVRIDSDYLTDEDKEQFLIFKKAAIEYVKGYTGLSEAELEQHEDITIAVLVLISDMFDNRQMYVDKNNINKVVSTILGMYQTNLL